MKPKRVLKRRKLPTSTSGKRKRLGDFDVSLATEISEPSNAIGDYVLWIYGGPGVGKTSLASHFPKVHMLMAETRGANALRVFRKPINEWLEAKAYLPLIKKDKKFQTFSLDVLEYFYQLCFEQKCEELGIEHPQDEKDFGKSWGKINKEFFRFMTALGGTGKGLVLISHAIEKEIKMHTGESYDLIRPNLGGSVLQTMNAAVDLLGYMYATDEQHYMRIRPNDEIMAKCRLPENFNWPDGEPIKVIPLGRDSQSSYDNFVAAFNNELPRPKTPAKKAVKKTLKRKGK